MPCAVDSAGICLTHGLLLPLRLLAIQEPIDILVDNGAHTLRNMGDVAMLQVTVRRVCETFPHARLGVLTSRPELLVRYCPAAAPVSAGSRDAAYLPDAGPGLWGRLWKAVGGSRTVAPPREFREAFDSARGIILAGGGYLNDGNPVQTEASLRMLQDAVKRGKFTAIFSQGLGPLQAPGLVSLLRNVCSAGVYVGLRESRRGPGLLREAGALPGKIAVTGDDAIETAWAAGVFPERNALGISVRQVDYSGIGRDHLANLEGAFGTLQSRLKAPVVPIPISFNAYEDDARAIAAVTGSPIDPGAMDHPAELIRRAGCCRMILTGTYHAAVFALARGVPCLGFYASDYYRHKMEGLADLFPGGCRLVDLRQADAGQQVVRTGIELWQEAPALADNLRSAAAAHTARSREFYRQALPTSLG